MKILKIFLLLLTIILLASCSFFKKKSSDTAKGKKGEENIIDNSINVIQKNNNFAVNNITSEDGLISNNILQVLFEDDYILCLTSNGIVRINKESGRIVNHTFVEKNVNFLNFNIIDNQLYIIDKNGLYKFINNKLIPVCKLKNIIPGIFKKKNKIFCFTENGEIYSLETNSTNIKLIYTYTNFSPKKLIQDDDNVFLSSKHALYQLNTDNFKLTNILISSNERINTFLKEEDMIYFGYYNLYAFDISLHSIKKLISITNTHFITFLYKENKQIYIGENKGINLLNLINTNYENILKDFAIKNSYVNHIIRDENILWISTKNNGLIRYIK